MYSNTLLHKLVRLSPRGSMGSTPLHRAGNWSNMKGVGAGVFERKIDVGPGYRIYFGKDGDRLVILLSGSTKQRQQQAIETAQERWAVYRRRKTKKKL